MFIVTVTLTPNLTTSATPNLTALAATTVHQHVTAIGFSVFRILLCTTLDEAALSDDNPAASRVSLKRKLVESWSQKHTVYYHNECPPIPKKLTPKFVPSQCFRLGMCICKPGQNQDASFFHANLVRWLKPSFQSVKKKKSAPRQLLEDCYIVLRFQMVPALPVSAENAELEQWLDMAFDQDQEQQQHPQQLQQPPQQQQVDDDTSIWIHPGYLNFTSWQGSGMRLSEGDLEVLSGQQTWTLLHTVVTVASTLPGLFARHFDFALAWTCEVFAIIQNDQPLHPDNMIPDRVKVSRFHTVSKMLVWRGSANEKHSRDQQQAKKRTRAGGPAKGRPASKNRAAPRPRGQSHPMPPVVDPVVDAGSGLPCEDAEDAGSDAGSADPEHVNSDAGGNAGSNAGSDSEHGNQDAGSNAGSADSAEGDLHAAAWLPADVDYGLPETPLSPSPEAFLLEEDGDPTGEPDGDAGSDAGGGAGSDAGSDAGSHSSSSSSDSDSSDDSDDSDSGSGISVVSALGAVIREPGPRAQGTPEIVFILPGYGDIRYNLTHEFMLANCRRQGHGQGCKRQRTVKLSTNLARLGQGRPIGLLIAWLLQSEQHDSKHSHCAAGSFSFEARQQARVFFASLPNSADFLQFERATLPNEENEPLEIP